MKDSTQAMVLTGPGQAAIAVIRLAGPGAGAIAAGLAPVAACMRAGDFRHAILRQGEMVLDDALVVRIDDSTFELHVHGGRAVIDGVLKALRAAGVEIVSADATGAGWRAWPEETLVSREVLAALRNVTTTTGLRLLARQRTMLAAWAAELMKRLEAGTPLWQAQSLIQWVLFRSAELRFVITPPRVAIVGPPNAGKSTLANALLGRPVSITSEMPGTTRDWVDATAVFVAGETEVAVILVDTAGVRETADPIEQESIVRTLGQAEGADLVLAVVDGTLRAGDLAWLGRLDQRAARLLLVVNKCDVPGGIELDLPGRRRRVRVSGKEHFNLEALMRAALEELGVAEVGAECMAFTLRQLELLKMAACGDRGILEEALGALIEGAADGGK